MAESSNYQLRKDLILFVGIPLTIALPIVFVVIFLLFNKIVHSTYRIADLYSRISVGMIEDDIKGGLGRPHKIFYKKDYEEALRKNPNPYQKKGDLELPIENKVFIYNKTTFGFGHRLYVFFGKENKVSCIFLENSKYRPFWYQLLCKDGQ